MKFSQVDISKKEPTEREAIAVGTLKAPKEVIEKVRERKIPKGDPLSCAEIAGIMAAKNTSNLLPLCHNIQISSTKIEFEFINNGKIKVKTKVKSFSSTGVEMEALFATAIALLSIYDFCKTITKQIKIEDIHLVEKSGGKSGRFLWEEI